MRWLETVKSLWDPTAELRALLLTDGTQEKSPTALLKGLQFQIDRRLGLNAPSAFQGLFRGHGIEFLNLREYQPGDDVRKIDWNVMARTGTLHVRQHYEERQVPVWFFIDLTAGMHFGQTAPKLTAVKSLIGLLGLMALNAGHRLGFVLWDGTESATILPLQRSQTHLEHVLHRLEQVITEGPQTVLPEEMALPNLGRLFQSRSMVMMFSDFEFLGQLPQSSLRVLGQLRGHHQVTAMLMVDSVEEHLVLGHGWLPLASPSGTQTAWIDTDDRWAVRAYIKAFRKALSEKESLLKTFARIHRVSTADNLLDTVIRWARAA